MPVTGEVVIIGGGAVGSACAWALARSGASVTVIQRESTRGEGWRAAAGMLAAQIEAGPDEPMLALGLAGRAFYRNHVAALQAATGIDIGFQQRGILQVARTEADALAFKAKVAWQRQQSHHADWLEPDEVAHGWPWLPRTMGGFWSPEDGALDPVALVEAFRADAITRGVRFIADTAVGLDRTEDHLAGVICERDRYPARTVVIAGGAWAGKLGQLPRPLSVEPVRGQMAAFPCPPNCRIRSSTASAATWCGAATSCSRAPPWSMSDSMPRSPRMASAAWSSGSPPSIHLSPGRLQRAPGPAFAPGPPTGCRSSARNPGCPGSGMRRGMAATASSSPG